MNATTTTETDPRDVAIRRYLATCAGEPVEDAELDALQGALGESDDPVERLRLVGEIAKRSEPALLEEVFVAVARRWAQDNDIPASAFAAMGVPRPVLVKAGVVGGAPARARPAKAPVAAPHAPSMVERAQQGGALSAEELFERLPWGQFVLADVQREVGGYIGTLRQKLTQLVEEGKVRNLGPYRGYGGQGRQPHLFERAEPYKAPRYRRRALTGASPS